MNYCVVITTCENQEKAELLAKSILEERLAACVQLSSISSFYRWEGAVANDDEIKLLIKTREELYDKLEKHIAENHAYDVPEIIMLSVGRGSIAYLGWIDEETAGRG